MALMLSVVRACSISGVWGTDHTIGLSFSSVAFNVLFQIVVLGLFCQFAIIHMTRYPMACASRLGLHSSWRACHCRAAFVALVGRIAGARQHCERQRPMALLLFWSTTACATQTIRLPSNRIVGGAGAAYALLPSYGSFSLLGKMPLIAHSC